MLEITRKNCYKCDLETIIGDDSKYFWINLRDFEAETESKWLNMFNKHGNAPTLKYRTELTQNIKFQPDRIFVRNDLFEQIIKSCKATNAEFTMLKEKLGICPYEENYNEKEIIKFNIEESFNKLLDESDDELIKEFNKELNKESNKESDKESDKESKESDKETSDEELIEIINPKKDEDTTDWYDKNKFKKILTTIDRIKFNHKNKVGKLKFNDINNLVNNIKNNTISERLAKQKLNALDEIRKVETKNKRLINRQKIVSSLVDDLLETIFNNNNNNNNNNKSMNEDNNVSVNENDNVSVNENDNDNKNDSESDSDSDSDNDDDDDHDHDEQYYKIKQINNWSKTIDKTKSFEQQIEILKTKDFLDEYWHDDYHDDKELNIKIFKVKVSYILNDLDEQLFKKIFGHTFVALADKLLNTTSKEENKRIIDNIKNNRDKICEQDDFNNFVTQPGHKRGDLNNAVKMLLNVNELLSLDDNNYGW